MENITKETRQESNLKVDRQTRYKEILECLEKHPNGLTAREIANELGYKERNATAPRLTELTTIGKVEAVSKRYDEVTKTNVSVYKIKTKKIELGTLQRCENCRYGHLTKKNKEVKKVECSKLRGEVPLKKFKSLRCCQFFEKMCL